ncbi:hypothetical protein [Longimicrobium terrae]|uniref:Energy-coupling factor transporter transmembrane protein EcfT n=1 Tax=Longimicrobium terrae TaxID=1639882 RepID=A0A841GZ35_9BACT|nr:hypothetical protein [Longimicrobium terrae]MBB4636480.1 energy-coupling factor transporter transmembrane protein EcfT [Longimicrobium terrae]MBB6070996.1 energy-coupling factor transporter transmembrane protein EcfT [Longimicrobium terrae]NNC29018.1 hypothetical protein [Longimicrobium terrae]
MLDAVRLLTATRIVPRILTAALIAAAYTATWPHASLSSLLQVLIVFPVAVLGLYLLFWSVNPDWAYPVSGVLLSGGLAGLAVVARLPGTDPFIGLASIHPAWYAAMLVQAAVWWTEGEGWRQLTEGIS